MKALQIPLTILIWVVLIAASVRGQESRQGVITGAPAVIERTVPMGAYRFHYKDQGTGGTSVVMDAGLCQPMDTWGDVTAQIAAFTRVFIYDRPGLGSSSRILPKGAKKSAPPLPLRTSKLITQELHDLLGKAAVPAPYVLVGHSFGGFNVRLYASQYPNEVAGIVLLDGSHEEQSSHLATLMPSEKQVKYAQLNHGANCERVDLETSAEQLREAPPLPNIPFTVITSAVSATDVTQSFLEMQADLARRAPFGVHIFARQSGHFIQHDRPDIVVEAIRHMVEQMRPYSIPLPTEDDLKQTRILHISIPSEAVFSGAALVFSGLVGWQWRKRMKKVKAEMNRAQRRQALRKEKKRSGE